MQIQPRQQLLDAWRATARLSYPDSSWRFGGREGTNSISDAEQLLCLMAPATEVPIFRLDKPGVTDLAVRATRLARITRTMVDTSQVLRCFWW